MACLIRAYKDAQHGAIRRNNAQQRATTGPSKPASDQAKHPIRRHDAIAPEALPKLNTRVRFPSSAPYNTWSEAVLSLRVLTFVPCSCLARL